MQFSTHRPSASTPNAKIATASMVSRSKNPPIARDVWLEREGATQPKKRPRALLAHGLELRAADEFIEPFEALVQAARGRHPAHARDRDRENHDGDADREHQLDEREGAIVGRKLH